MSVPKAIAKAITITAQSQELHTSVKIKNILKWLKAGHEVRVSIAGSADKQKAMEVIYKQLEKNVKTGARFLQKNVKPQSIGVTLKPTEDAVNLEVDEVITKTRATNVDDVLKDITADGDDMFSSDFEKKLLNSIKEERLKNKKRKS